MSHHATGAAEGKATACILCSRNCGIEVELEGRRLAKIRGDERHPISRGYLCQKAARLDHYQNHADRLTTPLRRRADGSFEQVSWETAIDEIARKLVHLRPVLSHRSSSAAAVVDEALAASRSLAS